MSSVKRSYDWDPASYLRARPRTSVLGVEAPLWSETLSTSAHIEYMAFPRLPGIAELGWSPASTHDWDDYKVRLAAQGPRWDALGIGYYRSPEVPWPRSEGEAAGRPRRPGRSEPGGPPLARPSSHRSPTYGRPRRAGPAVRARGQTPTPNSRAISIRWTSLVPSPISRILASRHIRATGYSFMKP